jgi:hypothetical protein
MHLMIEPKALRRELEIAGFNKKLVGADGTLRMEPGASLALPFFAGEYRRLTCCYVVLAAKGRPE